MQLKNLLFAFFFVLSFHSVSQVNSHAIGARLDGSHYGHFGGEISYQLGLGDKNRLELDLGWRNHRRHNWSHMGLSVIYHWVWNITAGLNWYVGPGAQIGWFDDRDPFDDDYLGLAIGGQLGLEYDFNTHGVPIQLSLDIRPMWNFLGWYGGFGYGSALGIRYVIP